MQTSVLVRADRVGAVRVQLAGVITWTSALSSCLVFSWEWRPAVSATEHIWGRTAGFLLALQSLTEPTELKEIERMKVSKKILI